MWWAFGLGLVVGAILGALAYSLALSAHEEEPTRYFVGVCRDCRQAVLEGQEYVVRHMDCGPAVSDTATLTVQTEQTG